MSANRSPIRSPIRMPIRSPLRPAPREDSTDYVFGNEVYFDDGSIHRCVFPGTSGVAEPTIIAPIGAPELIANGDMSDISDMVSIDCSVAMVNDKLHLTDGVPAGNGRSGKPFSVANTKTYLLSLGVFPSLSNPVDRPHFLRASTTAGLGNNGQIGPVTTDQTLKLLITALSTSTYYLTCVGSGVSGQITVFDDASSKEVTKDGTAAWETIG